MTRSVACDLRNLLREGHTGLFAHDAGPVPDSQKSCPSLCRYRDAGHEQTSTAALKLFYSITLLSMDIAFRFSPSWSFRFPPLPSSYLLLSSPLVSPDFSSPLLSSHFSPLRQAPQWVKNVRMLARDRESAARSPSSLRLCACSQDFLGACRRSQLVADNVNHVDISWG